jgi:hypothetical protein
MYRMHGATVSEKGRCVNDPAGDDRWAGFIAIAPGFDKGALQGGGKPAVREA